MIRFITVITIVLMPIISVSVGSTEGEVPLRSFDELDQRGNCGCDPPPPPLAQPADATRGR